jgi:hypothetical protein
MTPQGRIALGLSTWVPLPMVIAVCLIRNEVCPAYP